MTLYFVGMGLSMKHLSIEAVEVLKKVDKIYVDMYTSIIPDLDIDILKHIIGRDVVIVKAYRRDLEGASIRRIVEEASRIDVAILIPGDPFIATTHDAIRLEALMRGVPVKVIHGLSVYSVIPSAIGLQAYKFGKTVTLVYPKDFKPCSVIEVIHDNLSRGLHTLVLLDLKVDKGIAMKINEAVDILLDLEISCGFEKRLDKVIGVGVARAGLSDQVLRADLLPNLKKYQYPDPPHSIVIVARPHPIELDLLKYNCNLPDEVYEEYCRKS